MPVSFDQIPEAVWDVLDLFASGDTGTWPDMNAVRAAVGLGLLYSQAVNWAVPPPKDKESECPHPGQWGQGWITHMGLAALLAV